MSSAKIGIVVVTIALLALAGIFAARIARDGESLAAGVGAGAFLRGSRFDPPPDFVPMARFSDAFAADVRIDETAALRDSSSPNWWVNSGGRLVTGNGIARTISGDLGDADAWKGKYRRANSRDTDAGLHPQNVFRLVQIGRWRDYSQEMYFKITAINESPSPNRNASNGLFLFNRYQDGDSLYYTGVRVDGAAVIKKKIDGAYYTMAYKPMFGSEKYDRDANPNLLPIDAWIGLKSEVRTMPDGSVSVKLFIDAGGRGDWQLALEAYDNGIEYGGAAIAGAGYAGVRTDFMDVEMSGYKIEAL